MRLKKMWVIPSLAILVLISVIVLRQGKWDRYYKNKLEQLPCQVVVEALNLFKAPGKVIDIGCGVGNEATLMLNSDWWVWIIDRESKAIQIVANRQDIRNSTKLVPIVADFEKDSTWGALPAVDFIIASYSLPFCNRQNFDKVWVHIKQKLTHGGRFAGHFFGLGYTGFTENEMKQMTFLTREEVLCLFQGFDIESFQEIEEECRSGTGKAIHSHIFEVIVRK